jgi:type II secretory pathway component GspD/PulD (secretin)
MKRRTRMAISLFFAATVVWAAVSKEEWARFTISHGFKPGKTSTMDQWNGFLNTLAAQGGNDAESSWSALAARLGFASKGGYTDAEWTAIVAAVQTGKPVTSAPPPAAPPAKTEGPAISPSPIPAPTSPALLAPDLGGARPSQNAVPSPSAPPAAVPVPTPTATSPAALPVPADTGDGKYPKVSLDLREMDIVEVLKILSRQSGLNIVVGKNVSARVTVFLKNVDFWDALRTILESRDLAYARTGDLVTVMTAQDYERAFGVGFAARTESRAFVLKHARAAHAKTLLEPFRSRVGTLVVNEITNTLQVEDTAASLDRMDKMIAAFDRPVETRVFTVNHGTVEDILPKLTPLVSRDYGNIQADKRSNTIVMTDNPARLDEAARLIGSFDVRDRAVLIEAKIVQVILNDDFQWGVNWQYVFDRVAGNSRNSPITGSLSGNLLNVPLTAVTPDAAGRVTAKGVTGNVKITRLPHGAEFSSIMNFLETMGKTNMLSSPRVMALNNQEARIHVGTKEPVLTRNIVNAGSSTTQPIVTEDVKFEPVGVSLTVTPRIGSDGFISMKIRPEVSALESTLTTENGSSIPIIRLSEAESSILVKDGTTVVIGGLIEDRAEDINTRVPVLGSIPLVGIPFRGKKKVLSKTELVIFLTPRIETGDTDAVEAEVYLPRYEKILDQTPKKKKRRSNNS